MGSTNNNSDYMKKSQVPDKVFKAHFEKLFSKSSPADTLNLTDDLVGKKAAPAMDLSGPPTKSEVDAAVRKLKLGRAPGSNDITPDFFRHGGPMLVDRLVNDFELIWPELD
jgi:hypothetical protein